MWPDDERIENEYLKYCEDNDRDLFGMLINDNLVGLMGILHLSEEVKEIKHIAIKGNFRRQGIGRAMIMEYIRLNTSSELTAETDREAVGFYEQMGFEITSLGEKYPGVERFRCILNTIE